MIKISLEILNNDISRFGISSSELSDLVEASCKKMANTVNGEGTYGQFRHLVSQGWNQNELLQRALFRKLRPGMRVDVQKPACPSCCSHEQAFNGSVISTDKGLGTVAVRDDDGQCFNIHWHDMLRITNDLPARFRTRYLYTDVLIKRKAALYDAIEMHGVRQYTDPANIEATICEVDDEEPEFFSVYVHLKTGGVECVGDFSWYGDAHNFASKLNKKYGYPINNYVRKII